jgi:peptidoglycan/LPS O-acetylase OafA/YrhL
MSNLNSKSFTEQGTAAFPQPRLDFLDGIRGLAAVYVILFHIWQAAKTADDLPSIAARAIVWMAFGRSAVAVFIVLSGFCLMMPVARSSDGKLRGGVLRYFQKRAWRILPPYYIALALSLGVLALVPGLKDARHLWWSHTVPAFTPDVLLSHALLYHNWHGAWIFRINGPLWSVATECQIYLLFPLLLLPLWRRCGLMVMVAVAFAVGLAPHLLTGRFGLTAPWFLGLFALGMVAAIICFSSKPSAQQARTRLPWGFITTVLCALYVGIACYGIATRRPFMLWTTTWRMDVLVGVAAMSLLVFCTRVVIEKPGVRRPLVLRLLEAPWSVALGAFSYSIYLVHEPVVGLAEAAGRSLALSPVMCLITLFGAVPLSLGIAYLFHLFVERHFMPGAPQTKAETVQTAALSPAP